FHSFAPRSRRLPSRPIEQIEERYLEQRREQRDRRRGRAAEARDDLDDRYAGVDDEREGEPLERVASRAVETGSGEKQWRGRGGREGDPAGGRDGRARDAEHDGGEERRVTGPRGAQEVSAVHRAAGSAVHLSRCAIRATRSPSAFARSLSSSDSVGFQSAATCVAP